MVFRLISIVVVFSYSSIDAMLIKECDEQVQQQNPEKKYTFIEFLREENTTKKITWKERLHELNMQAHEDDLERQKLSTKK